MIKALLTLFLTVHLVASMQAHSIMPSAVGTHKSDCYTQGLFFLNQTHLFESCGLYNQSYYHVLKYSSSPFSLQQTFVSEKPWKNNIFLEGSTLFKGFIYVLTWRENIVYKFTEKTFELVGEKRWKSQGWGLTHNDTHMFATDGSDTIYVINEQFQILDKRSIITQSGRRANNLNQLEYVNGSIYANIYYDRFIHKINYESGKIEESYDGLALIQKQKSINKALRSDQVFNGIAYNNKTNKFILTGKDWKTIYQVQF